MKYLIFILFPVFLHPQDSTSLQILQRRTQELINKIGTMPVNLFWDSDTSGLVDRYMIFYIQGEDTSKFVSMFGFETGASFAQAEPWWIESALYDSAYIKIKRTTIKTFVRLGIIGIKSDGSKTPLRCIPKVIEVRENNILQNVKIN